MDWKKILTPKDTEELKPNLFIQTRYRKIYNNEGNLIAREPVGYRQIEPLFWNNKFRTKEQLRTVFSLRTAFTIALILFIAWAYVHDKGSYRDFYETFAENPIKFCEEVYWRYSDADLKPEVSYADMYTNSVSGNT